VEIIPWKGIARALAESVVVWAAGVAVGLALGFGFGDTLVFGDAEALGLGDGEGDFFVAAFATGAQQAKATVQAVIRWILFFIVGGCGDSFLAS
jgi:hypothetical protein